MVFVYDCNDGQYVDMWPSSQWYARAVRQNSIPARNGGYRVQMPLQETIDWTLPFKWGVDEWGWLCMN